MTDLVALGVQTPQINTVGNAVAARGAAIQQLGEQQQQEAAALEHIAQLGFGVMGGKLDGPIDPNRFKQMITLLGNNPLAQKLQDNPDLLRTITAGSAQVASQNQNNEQFDMAKKAFDLQLQTFNRPVFKAPGEVAFDPATGKPVDGGQQNGFYGTGMDSQAYNYLLKGQKDPSVRSTPEYAAAWSYITAPKPQQTPQGLIYVPTPPPQGFLPPEGAQAPQAAPMPSGGAPTPSPTAAVPAMGGVGAPDTPAPIGSMSMVGPPAQPTDAIPGTAPFNESQARVSTLAGGAIPDIKRVVDGFPALISLQDQLLGGVDSVTGGNVGRMLQKPEYKQASDAMKSTMVDMLYFASGANLNKDEWTRKAEGYLPSPLDDPQTNVNKLERFANDMTMLAKASKDPDLIAWAKQAVSGLAETEAKILGPSKTDTKSTLPPNAINSQVIDGKTYYQLPGDHNVYSAD